MDIHTSLANAPIILDNHCPDGIAAIFGPKLTNNSASPIFRQEFALMDLSTADIVGKCTTIVNIKVKDQKNKAKFLELIGTLYG